MDEGHTCPSTPIIYLCNRCKAWWTGCKCGRDVYDKCECKEGDTDA